MAVQGSTNGKENTNTILEAIGAMLYEPTGPTGKGGSTPGADSNFWKSASEQAVIPADTQLLPSAHVPNYMDSLDLADKFGDEVFEDSVLRHREYMREELRRHEA